MPAEGLARHKSVLLPQGFAGGIPPMAECILEPRRSAVIDDFVERDVARDETFGVWRPFHRTGRHEDVHDDLRSFLA